MRSSVFCGILAVFLCFQGSHGIQKDYTGYEVIDIPAKDAQLAVVQEMQSDPEIDVWQSASPKENKPHRILVPPDKLLKIKKKLAKFGIAFEVSEDKLDKKLAREQKRLGRKLLRLLRKASKKEKKDKGGKGKGGKGGGGEEDDTFDYEDYNTFEDIINELDVLAANCSGDVTCSVLNADQQSYENRNLTYLKISKEGEGRKGFWFDATIHAREWLAPATLLKVMRKMILEYDTDDDVKMMVDTYDWYFMPVMNPDGYVYTWTDDRFWRKSRSPNAGIPECPGTDLNRNYDNHWSEAGTSTNPCFNTYHGASAASEPETQAIQSLAQSLSGDLIGWVTIHTFIQKWLQPYGFVDSQGNCAHPPDSAELFEVLEKAAVATNETRDTVWEFGSICELLIPVTGSTTDYVKAQGIKYSFAVELGGGIFNPEPSEIDLSFQEFWNGIVAMVKAINEQTGQA